MQKRDLVRAVVGLLVMLAGAALAAWVQTDGGDVEVTEMRVPLPEGGGELSALLYRPVTATAENPAPGVLAVHGYINSRETQSGFAIELARNGFVVLAMDQTGHGFSDGAAFSYGFGGPIGLGALRSLPFVDPDRIGLEGHSMGGWTSLAAAAAMPDGYRSVALVGSSTGAPFAAEGTPDFPKNAAVIFSTYDEFGPLMWGVEKAANAGDGEKMRALFGVDGNVEAGRLYGDIEAGTARLLTQPVTTHPGDHLSGAAIEDVVDWMQLTLVGPTDVRLGQAWHWKEIGTLVALIGAMIFLTGLFGLAIGWTGAGGAAEVVATGSNKRLALFALIPAITYFPLVIAGAFAANLPVWSQNVTNQIMVWAIGNTLIAWLLMRKQGGMDWRIGAKGVLAALLAAAGLYLASLVLHHLFLVDMRFWVVALKPMAWHHVPLFLAYLVPFTLFFWISQTALHRSGLGATVPRAIAATAGGLALFLAIIYAWLFAAGRLPPFSEPLFSIVLIQFVPVMAMAAILSVVGWRRTGSALPGALLCGLVVTWYIVAGQATHVV